MKKLFFLFAAACIIASCSKNDPFNTGQFSPDAFKKGMPLNVPVIVVPPDEDGDGDDTEELMAAFADAEPGSVIKLLPGVYHTGVMELYGFRGKIIGAGKDKTIIIPSGPIDGSAQIDDRNLLTSWWRIIGGDLTVSDLTFKTGDGPLISDVDSYSGTQGLLVALCVNNYNADYYPNDPPFMNFTLKNVKISCGLFDDPSLGFYQTAYNVLMALWIGADCFWPPEEGIKLTKGNYNVTDCCFENGYDGLEFFSFGENATGIVDKIKTNNCGFGIYMTANYSSRIFITNSIFSNSTINDITIEDADWGLLYNIKSLNRCQFKLTGNKFNVSNPISSVVFRDYYVIQDQAEKWPMQAMLKGNLFSLSEGSTGISAWNSQDIQIRNNHFAGLCDAGIIVDGQEITLYNLDYSVMAEGTPWAKNALILGNNFSSLKPGTAAVVLGEKSMNCTVIGTGKEKVLDLGEGNRVTGMKKVLLGHHLGPAIRDNFRMHRRMRPH